MSKLLFRKSSLRISLNDNLNMGFILVNKNLKTNHTNSVQMELKVQKEKKNTIPNSEYFLRMYEAF